MLSRLSPPQPDPIIRLMMQFRDDPRPDRIDLGVGVYRDETGATPVMAAVRQAELRLAESAQTKSYPGLTGAAEHATAMGDLVLGGAVARERVAATGAPGGTGALRQLLDLVRLATPRAGVWISRPSWPNHAAIVAALGLGLHEYRYFDAATGQVDPEAMLDDLATAQAGDVVILHGCCHNPTGADLDLAAWAELGALCERQGLLPLVELAYQGFAEGVDHDAAPLRHLAARLPETLVAVSGSKSFGLYRDRVGMAFVIGADAPAAARAEAALAALNRTAFAFPPDHGARVVTTILGDPALRSLWLDELAVMRNRILANRQALARALAESLGDDRFGFLGTHRGMFSLLGLDPATVTTLRDVHGVYLIGDSRINLAALGRADIEPVARAMAAVCTAPA